MRSRCALYCTAEEWLQRQGKMHNRQHHSWHHSCRYLRIADPFTLSDREEKTAPSSSMCRCFETAGVVEVESLESAFNCAVCCYSAYLLTIQIRNSQKMCVCVTADWQHYLCTEIDRTLSSHACSVIIRLAHPLLHDVLAPYYLQTLDKVAAESYLFFAAVFHHRQRRSTFECKGQQEDRSDFQQSREYHLYCAR